MQPKLRTAGLEKEGNSGAIDTVRGREGWMVAVQGRDTLNDATCGFFKCESDFIN